MKFLTLILLSVYVFKAQASSWESLVEGLTRSRAEIETLSQEIDLMQKEKQANLDQLLMRKTDTDSQLEKEKLRRLQLTEKLKRLEGLVKNNSKSDPEAQKKLQSWILNFETIVKNSIPFEQDLRLQILSGFKERIKKNHEPIEFIMSDFWSFIEDEFKLAQTNEYRIVNIEVQGKKKKSEVARLGLMTMFAVSPDGIVRRAVKKSNSWDWQKVKSGREKESILTLVKNLKNKNETEIYRLPIDIEKAGVNL